MRPKALPAPFSTALGLLMINAPAGARRRPGLQRAKTREPAPPRRPPSRSASALPQDQRQLHGHADAVAAGHDTHAVVVRRPHGGDAAAVEMAVGGADDGLD